MSNANTKGIDVFQKSISIFLKYGCIVNTISKLKKTVYLNDIQAVIRVLFNVNVPSVVADMTHNIANKTTETPSFSNG